jgi:hypothetical protein
MMVGKLSILIEDHKTLGKIFVIRATNSDIAGDIFDVNGDHMVLRVSRDTAIMLSQYIDESVEEDFLNVEKDSSISN